MRKILLAIPLLFLTCGDQEPNPPVDRLPEARSASASSGFRLVPSSESGITFGNEIKETFETNLINLAYIYNGGGVCVLDYDQDGLEDLFFVGSQEACRLYRNLGEMRFEEVGTSAGVNHSAGFRTGATAVDVNADGYPDLYVCRSGIDNSAAGQNQRSNLLFVNQQDGTFREQSAEYGLNSNRPSTQAYWFDYDLDGDLDCYLINTPTDFATTTRVRVQPVEGGYQRLTAPIEVWESDQLFRNDGNRFVDVSAQAGINNRAFGLSAQIMDVNEDGRPDIYVANDYIEPDFLYVNQGNGTFVDQIDRYMRHQSANSMGTDLGDINNDGRQDLVALDMLAEDPVRRQELVTAMVEDRYQTLVRLGYGHQYTQNTLQLNLGNGQWSEVAELAGVGATDWSWTPLLADFDNDRFADLYITNGYRYDISNTDYVAFTADSVNRLGGITPERFPDFEQYLELIPQQPLANYMYRNNGRLQFDDLAAEWGLDQAGYSTSAVYADLDDDGDLDLAVSNIEMEAFLYENQAAQTTDHHFLRVRASGPAANPEGIGLEATIHYADEQQSKTLYRSRGFLGSVEAVLHFGLGELSTVDRLELRWPDGRTETINRPEIDTELEVQYGNASANGAGRRPAEVQNQYFTLANTQLGLQFQHQENVFDDFARERLLPYRLSLEGPALAVGDFNGDGNDDLYFGGATHQAGELHLWVNSGWQSTEQPAFAGHNGAEDVAATAFDADSDGDLDLYVVSGGAQLEAGHPALQDRLYLNDGAGRMTYARDWLPELRFSGGAVLVTDLNEDGRPDLVVGGRHVAGRFPTAPPSRVLLHTGSGYRDATAEIMPQFDQIGMVTSLATADLNGDGTNEILVAGDFMSVQVFAKTQTDYRLTDDFGQLPTGLWKSLLVFDADGDGDLDLLAGNLGLNSRLKTSPEEPLTLVAADFDQNGSIDPILSAYQGGELAPITRRDNLVLQLPGLKDRVLRNNRYARMSLSDLFAAGSLNDAMHLPIQSLETTLFINENGQLRPTQLPVEVQLAPVRSALARDLNEDGRLDLVLVGNDFSPEVETGRFDAANGWVLIAQADGGYDYVNGMTSGFWAALDARRVMSFSAGGQQGVVVANNSGVAGVFME